MTVESMFESSWFRVPGQSLMPEVAGVMHAVTGRKGLSDEDVLEGLLLKLLRPEL
jgi:hypothetical protein